MPQRILHRRSGSAPRRSSSAKLVPASAPGISRSRLPYLQLQRTIGNRALLRTLDNQANGPSPQIFRKIVSIGEERVDVADDKEEAEAREILKRIKDDYGIEVSSKTTIEGIKDEYTDVKKKVKDKLKARHWKLRELRALERALKHYAPILGGERANSTRSGDDQEVTSVGKVHNAIDEDTPAGKLDTTTLGEYFSSKKNMGLFKSSENYKSDFSTVEDQLTGTFVHEIAHGLLAYAIPDYIKGTGYWKDANTKLAKDKRTETPITSYGQTSADEDICESAMMYFVDPKRLEKDRPVRYAFMEQLGKDWLPPPKEAPQIKPAPEDVPKSEDVKKEVTGGAEVSKSFSEMLAFFKDLESASDKSKTPVKTGA